MWAEYQKTKAHKGSATTNELITGQGQTGSQASTMENVASDQGSKDPESTNPPGLRDDIPGLLSTDKPEGPDGSVLGKNHYNQSLWRNLRISVSQEHHNHNQPSSEEDDENMWQSMGYGHWDSNGGSPHWVPEGPPGILDDANDELNNNMYYSLEYMTISLAAERFLPDNSEAGAFVVWCMEHPEHMVWERLQTTN